MKEKNEENLFYIMFRWKRLELEKKKKLKVDNLVIGFTNLFRSNNLSRDERVFSPLLKNQKGVRCIRESP